MAVEPVNLSSEPEEDLLHGGASVDQADEDEVQVNLRLAASVRCPSCGTDFVPLVPLEGGLKKAFARFALYRSRVRHEAEASGCFNALSNTWEA